tara:strand:- start:230 stop:427 length:198 start_codon:yes stop_codon:yes gene_type:complete
MKLHTYIEQQGITLAVAASALGVTRQAVNLWVKGKRIPRPEQMARIQMWTGGEVKPQDFYKDSPE